MTRVLVTGFEPFDGCAGQSVAAARRRARRRRREGAAARQLCARRPTSCAARFARRSPTSSSASARPTAVPASRSSASRTTSTTRPTADNDAAPGSGSRDRPGRAARLRVDAARRRARRRAACARAFPPPPSRDAGGFLCNHVFYVLMRAARAGAPAGARRLRARAAAARAGARQAAPSMPLESLVLAREDDARRRQLTRKVPRTAVPAPRLTYRYVPRTLNWIASSRSFRGGTAIVRPATLKTAARRRRVAHAELDVVAAVDALRGERDRVRRQRDLDRRRSGSAASSRLRPRRRRRPPGRQRGEQQRAAAHHLFLFVIFCVTYAATSAICCRRQLALERRHAAAAVQTCETTVLWFFALGMLVRSGPPLPPCPVAPWHETQLSANTVLPAVGVAAAEVGVLACRPRLRAACRCPCRASAPGRACRRAPKSQRLSPCGVARERVAAGEEGDVLLAVLLEDRRRCCSRRRRSGSSRGGRRSSRRTPGARRRCGRRRRGCRRSSPCRRSRARGMSSARRSCRSSRRSR